MFKIRDAAFAAVIALGVACNFAAPVAAQMAVFEKPVKPDPDGAWWNSDPDAYHAFSELSNSDPAVTFTPIDGDNEITVKAGDVVEIDFSEMYGDQVHWSLKSKTGAAVGVFSVDFQTHFKDGRALIHEPGTLSWKFRATQSGDVVLVFSHGKLSAPDFNTEQPGDIRVLVHVH